LDVNAVLQIGAWYCLPDATDLPCYSYHDGNLALRVRSGQLGLPAHHVAIRRALAWERETYAKLTAIFVMSSWLADSFHNDFGVPRSKIHVVGAGINFDTIPTEQQHSRAPASFLMVGKDFERKGGRVLLEAFRTVRRAVPSAELVLIGPNLPDAPHGVRCLGYLSKKNPAELALIEDAYRRASVYVLPSLYEPFGISLLEAMAHGLPCIVARHCAMPEIVRHSESGLTVAPGDPETLAEAMIALAQSPATASQFGAAGRRRLVEHYTWPAVARSIKEIVSHHHTAV
jgi:glycosyltransferase involved in cell wall biosynthesis